MSRVIIEEDRQFKLLVQGAGIYEADSLIELIYIVIKHRFEHLFKGEGFID